MTVDSGTTAQDEVQQLAISSKSPASSITIRPASGWVPLNLRDLWEYRELLYFLVWRDLKVRYKQTVLGIGWVVLQPLATTLIFSIIFGALARIPSADMPYPVLALSGLVLWNYFAATLSRSGSSLISNANLITKVYFPRLIIPLAGAINGLVDLAVAFSILIIAMALFGITPSSTILILPLSLALLFGLALGVSLWLAALNVRYRDVNYLLPFLIQVWMYASPIIYPTTLIPERWRILYGLNPMVGIVEGFRWALTGRGEIPISTFLFSVFVVLLVMTSGMIFFRRVERTFADVV